MKDEGNHQGAVDKSFSEQRIRIVDANYILCEKNWTRTRIGTGSYGRWQVVSSPDPFFPFLFVVEEKRVWWISVGRFVLQTPRFWESVNRC